MNNEAPDAYEHLKSGEAWSQFCQQLDEIGQEALQAGGPDSKQDVAEMYRFLTQMVRGAFEAIVEGGAAEYVKDIARRLPHMLEPAETMAEAALALCSGTINGQSCLSRKLIHMLSLPVMDLDGKTIIGDANVSADLDKIY